jgi:hypothetical protein
MSQFDICTVIAFYGVHPGRRSLVDFFRATVEWFTEIGHPPDKLAVGTPGKFGKQQSFSRAANKLQQFGFDNITTLEITSMLPGGEYPLRDYLLTCTYSALSHYATLEARSSLAALSRSSLDLIAGAVAEAVEPEYGIGYYREHKLGPSFYAIGICKGLSYSEEDMEAASHISKWGQIGMELKIWKKGLLRDLYPWNFVSELQLSALISGVSLRDWIQSDKRRGSLSSFWNGLTLWEVDEAHLVQVRSELWNSGLIFNWRDYLGEQ